MKRNNQSLTTKFSALALVLAMMLSLLAGCGQTTQPAASSTRARCPVESRPIVSVPCRAKNSRNFSYRARSNAGCRSVSS